MNHPGCVCGDALKTENARLQEKYDQLVKDAKQAVDDAEWAAEQENAKLRGVIEDALGRYQVTHIHAALRQALAAADEGEK